MAVPHHRTRKRQRPTGPPRPREVCSRCGLTLTGNHPAVSPSGKPLCSGCLLAASPFAPNPLPLQGLTPRSRKEGLLDLLLHATERIQYWEERSELEARHGGDFSHADQMTYFWMVARSYFESRLEELGRVQAWSVSLPSDAGPLPIVEDQAVAA